MIETIAVIALVHLTFAIPHSNDSQDWVTGQALDRQSQMAIHGHWADAPLRPFLFELAARQRIAVFVDRRVDPATKLNLTANDLTWDQLLVAVGADHQYGFARLENVYYFGPRTACLRLETDYFRLVGELRNRRQQLETNWLSPIGVIWARLSEPRTILLSMAAENGVTVVNPESIPHDLWPEFKTPDISPLLQALLLVRGFEKSIAISARGTKLKVIDEPVVESVRYTVHHLKNARSIAIDLRPTYRDVKLNPDGDSRIEIGGTVHAILPVIDQLISLQEPIVSNSEIVRFTVELKGSRASMLGAMAKQMNLELSFDVALADVLSEFQQFEFENATTEEIIAAALDGTGLRFRITESKLMIEP